MYLSRSGFQTWLPGPEKATLCVIFTDKTVGCNLPCCTLCITAKPLSLLCVRMSFTCKPCALVVKTHDSLWPQLLSILSAALPVEGRNLLEEQCQDDRNYSNELTDLHSSSEVSFKVNVISYMKHVYRRQSIVIKEGHVPMKCTIDSKWRWKLIIGVEIEKEANSIAFHPAHGLLVRVLGGSIAQWSLLSTMATKGFLFSSYWKC